jgi:hypothetical protein
MLLKIATHNASALDCFRLLRWLLLLRSPAALTPSAAALFAAASRSCCDYRFCFTLLLRSPLLLHSSAALAASASQSCCARCFCSAVLLRWLLLLLRWLLLLRSLLRLLLLLHSPAALAASASPPKSGAVSEYTSVMQGARQCAQHQTNPFMGRMCRIT